jgi:hypothetical protein
MYKHLLFLKSPSFDDLRLQKIISEFNLVFDFKYDNTYMYECDDFRISIDLSVIRVIIYDSSNYSLIKKIKQIFYNQN